jgi:phosphoserine phosphatase SerB
MLLKKQEKDCCPLICFDMDGTLIDCETLEVIAKEIGVEEEVKRITDLAMEGELDFEEAVRQRLALLKGLPLGRLDQIADRLPLMPGAEDLIALLKARGFTVGIITGGFDIVADKVARRLGVDFFVANTLEVEDGILTGGFKLKVDGNKDVLIQEAKEHVGADIAVAVGDGANDIPMLKAADIGIAFNARAKVKEQVPLQVDGKDLLKIMEFIGYRGLNILVDQTVHEIAQNALRLIGDVKVVDTTKMDDDMVGEVEVLVIRTNKRVDEVFLDRAVKLKIIATATTGLNHIDLACARKNGIAVVNAPGENADAVADYVFRMLFHVLDDVFYTVDLLKAKQEFKKIKKENVRHEIGYNTLGIIGFGNVGRRVARRAEAFGLEVKAYDPYVAEAKNTLHDVLKADIVTLHPELTDETLHMIDEAALDVMKEDAVLINAARGKIIREADLVKALKQRKIRLAILDVYENEPEYTELFELDNAVVTPHIAGNTVEARINAGKRVFLEIVGLLEGLEQLRPLQLVTAK